MSLQTYQSFTPAPVKVLTESFFWVDSREKISLKTDDPTLVLFYDSSPESNALQNIFLDAAKLVGRNPIFAAVDLNTNPMISTNLGWLRINNDHPLSWVGTGFTPFIVVYRNTYPQAFYNGPPEAEALREYAITYAGQPLYYEKTFTRKLIPPPETTTSGSGSGSTQSSIPVSVPVRAPQFAGNGASPTRVAQNRQQVRSVRSQR